MGFGCGTTLLVNRFVKSARQACRPRRGWGGCSGEQGGAKGGVLGFWGLFYILVFPHASSLPPRPPAPEKNAVIFLPPISLALCFCRVVLCRWQHTLEIILLPAFLLGEAPNQRRACDTPPSNGGVPPPKPPPHAALAPLRLLPSAGHGGKGRVHHGTGPQQTPGRPR